MIQPNNRLSATITWGLLQILLLALGAGGFPLWAHPPLPPESLAFLEMICGQTLISALFPPLFATDAVGVLMGVMLMLPMDELAGLLSNTPQLSVLTGFSLVSVWLVGLAGLCRLLRQSRYLPLVGASATLFTAGGAVLDYLGAETRAAQLLRSPWVPLSPLPNLCLIIKHNLTIAWVEMLSPLLVFLIALALAKRHPKPRN